MKEGAKQVKFCIHCGAELPSGAKFCPDCGKAVETVPKYSATENPVVAGTASVLSDPKKRRVAFVVIAVAVILVLGIALLAGGKENPKDDLTQDPVISDNADAAVPDDDGKAAQDDVGSTEVPDDSTDSTASNESDKQDTEQKNGPEQEVGPWLLPDPSRISGYHFALNPDYTDFAFYTSSTPGDESIGEAYVAALEALGYKVVDTDYEEFGSAGDVQKWYLLHENVSREGEEGASGSVQLKLLHFFDNHYKEFTITFSEGISVDGYDPEPANSGGDDFFDKEDCGYCHGRGTCSTCNGSGRVQKYQHGIGWEWYDCSHCSMGECRFCGGSGKA